MSVLNKKFSLIEVLVVVAIIGILASLFMPALSKARESARTIQCVNNIKQHMTGAMMFTGDNDNEFWPRRAYHKKSEDPAEGGTPRTWDRYDSGIFYDTHDLDAAKVASGSKSWGSYKVRIWDYLPSDEVQMCPSHDHADADDKHRYQYSYGFSGAYDGVKLSAFIPSASELGTITDIDYTTHTEVIARAGQIYARHKAKLNIAFLDGHVEAMNALPFFDMSAQWNILGYSEPGNGVETGGNTGTNASWSTQHGDPVIE
ncbi:type II secretion system protein [Lentisphaera marina]|uniref:type II secretion system protein n=1 Tax=Lentisphaera marina TaxID=1111041 RepID=UPI002367260A|nr:type II secretion system protein [Lentisphaera marina]MDD7985543.1 type II secretion system protein [Lentisphaera marina]